MIIIGAGIAGASLASQLADERSVLLLEAEARPDEHSTGRSAALFSEIYGNPTVRALSRASRDFFAAPDFEIETPLHRSRGTLLVASKPLTPLLDAYAADPIVARATQRVSAAEARALSPVLGPSVVAGLYDAGSSDIDVHTLHHGYLRLARRRGARLVPHARVDRIERQTSGWRVHTPAGEFTCATLVNAAGAWAEEVARIAGVRRLELTPMRRTMAVIESPNASVSDDWPMVVVADESFYFKPDAGRLMISPADETPSAPCDAQPEEYDIALAAARYEELTEIPVRRILSRWAGLRTFAADRTPIIGSFPDEAGFVWMAGLGGYGIQTAPALAIATAAIVEGGDYPTSLRDQGLSAPKLSPARFLEPVTPQ